MTGPLPLTATPGCRASASCASHPIYHSSNEFIRTRLELENSYLREELREALPGAGRLLGESERLLQLVQQVELVAATDANVLILGESGTGKELVAREIHDRSRRRQRAMIRVNCASIPRDLFESG